MKTFIQVSFVLLAVLSSVQCATAQVKTSKADQGEEQLADAKRVAEEKTREAEDARRQLLRFRRYALAKESARILLDVSDNDLRKALAIQSHNFNVKSYGYVYDSDVFGALLAVATDERIVESLSLETSSPLTVQDLSIWAVDARRFLCKFTRTNSSWDRAELIKLPSNIKSPLLRVNAAQAQVALVSAGKLWIYDANAKSQLQAIPTPKPVDDIFFFTNDSFVTVSKSDGQLTHYQSKKAVYDHDVGASISHVCEGAAGQLIYTTSDAISSYRLDSHTTSEITDLKYESKASALNYDNQRDLLFVGHENGAIKIKTNADDRIMTLFAGKTAIKKIQTSSTHLITLSEDRSTRLWNLTTLRERPAVMPPTENLVDIIALNDVLLRINATSTGSTILFLPISPDKLAMEICKSTDRRLTRKEWTIFFGDEFPYSSGCPEP